LGWHITALSGVDVDAWFLVLCSAKQDEVKEVKIE